MQDEAGALEIVTTDALGAIERSQIDMQISTAKKFPRSLKAFKNEAETMISMSQETAEGCSYKLKRRNKDGTMKIIEGPSIRLLEICAYAYTNLRFGSRVTGENDDFVTTQGFAMDLERNNGVLVDVRRPIKTSSGQRFSIDMIAVTTAAASSIARRNALLGGAIPRIYVDQLRDFAKRKALGEIKDLAVRLQTAFEFFKSIGVEAPRLLEYLEKPSVEDCTLEELDILQGLKTALKEGDTTIEVEFPKEKAPVDAPDIGAKKEPVNKEPAKEPATVKTPEPPKPAETKALEPKPKTEPKPESKPGARKKKDAAPPAPATPPEPPAQPAQNSAPQAPPQAPPPEPPVEERTVLDLAEELGEKLTAGNVLADDFYDWLASSGRGQIFKFDPALIEDATQLPRELLVVLCAPDSKDLAACIRVHGKKPSS